MTEWLYERIDDIREDLAVIGATASLQKVDEIRDQLTLVQISGVTAAA